MRDIVLSYYKTRSPKYDGASSSQSIATVAAVLMFNYDIWCMCSCSMILFPILRQLGRYDDI